MDYAKLFGMDTLVFNDISEASLMTKYTGGEVYRRQASLSLHMQGGGGFNMAIPQSKSGNAFGRTGLR